MISPVRDEYVPPSQPPSGFSEEGLPSRFGKYTLLRKLSTGGMAELFIALQRSMAGFEKLVVIKRILPAMNSDASFVEMLLHEARIAATLSHPSIVQIFDVGQAEGTFYIAMEHIHGEDLRTISRQLRKRAMHPFPLEHAVAIALSACSGLAYAHEMRSIDGTPLAIVHRDISPHNILVTFTGDVKIVDFGIAKSDWMAPEETKSGMLKGKIPYMSPEQARGEPLDARTDIFSMGVLLFELTTGHRLFKSTSEFETLKLICEHDYPKPSELVLGYPKGLEAIVMRALSKDREVRFQTAREMQAAIEEFIRRDHVPVSTIALSRFMETLFEDKLVFQKEALRQGRKLADIILLEQDRESVPDLEASSRPPPVHTTIPSTAPVATRTITSVSARSEPGRERKFGPWLFGVAGIMLGAVAMWIETGHLGVVAGGAESKSAVDSPLSVAVAGGTCLLSIDGVVRGVAPTQLSVAPGSHRVTCVSEGGKQLSTQVDVRAAEPAFAAFDVLANDR